MKKPDFSDISLEQCIKFLTDKGMDSQAPHKCYQLLRFPDEKAITVIKPNIKYLEYFKQLYPSKVTITVPIKVQKDGITLAVPNELYKIYKKKSGFHLTPIIFSNGQVYGLLHDARNEIWTVFLPPGSSIIKNSPQVERKLCKLIEEKFKLNAELFYHNIEYQPEEGTEAYYWWPSWLVNHSIKHPGLEREEIVDPALVKILKDDKSYQTFVSGYQDFINKVK